MTTSQVIKTTTPMEKKHFCWKIANFSQIRQSKEALKQQQFQFSMGASIDLPTKWRCYLTCSSNRNYIGFYIKLDKVSVWGVKQVLLSLSSVKIDKYFTGSGVTNIQDMLKVTGWGYDKMIPQDPNDEQKALPLDSDGNLCLEIEVTLFNLASMETPNVCLALPSLISKFEVTSLKQLSFDLKNIYKSHGSLRSIPTTAKVISMDGKELFVHTELLAARSPVFHSMFQAPMLEAAEGVVRVDDISGMALEALFNYVYTGVLPENWKDAEIIDEFTYAAHKYMLDKLLEFLDQALGLVCSPNNCANLLDLAIKLNMKQAEKDLMEFGRNYLKKAEWQKMKQFFNNVDSEIVSKTEISKFHSHLLIILISCLLLSLWYFATYV